MELQQRYNDDPPLVINALVGCQLQGAGSFGLFGIIIGPNAGDSGYHTFNIPMNITNLHMVEWPVIYLNKVDLHTAQLLWNGGGVAGTAGSTLYLDARMIAIAILYISNS